MFKHILVPTDGSSLSLKAAKAAVDLAKVHKARITAIHVMAPYVPPTAGDGIMYYPDSFSPEQYKKAVEKEAQKEVQKPASSVIPLFAGFSQEEFNAFTKVMNVHPLPEGLPIVEQNDSGKSVYIIANGSVKVYTMLLSGERVDLAVLKSGDFFGEMSFLTGKPRTATVETAEDSTILEVAEDKLREIIAQRPHILDVLRKYSDMRAKGTNEKILESNK